MSFQDEILNNLQTFANELQSNRINLPPINLETRLNTPIHKINSELNKYKNNLRISHMNAVSIPKHRDEIRRVVSKTDLDFIGISETNTVLKNTLTVISIKSVVINFSKKIEKISTVVAWACISRRDIPHTKLKLITKRPSLK